MNIMVKLKIKNNNINEKFLGYIENLQQNSIINKNPIFIYFIYLRS